MYILLTDCFPAVHFKCWSCICTTILECLQLAISPRKLGVSDF